MNKNLKQNKWNNYELEIDYNIINESLITQTLDAFKKDVLDYLKEDEYLLMQFRIVNKKTNVYRSISYLDIIKKESFNSLYDIYSTLWELVEDEYNSQFDKPKIVLIFKLNSENNNIKKTNLEKRYNIKNKKIESINYVGYNLPSTMDFTTWGSYNIDPLYKHAVVCKQNSKAIYKIFINEQDLKVDFVVNDKVLFSFIDILNDGYNLNSFTRIITNKLKNKEIILKFSDSKVIFKSVQKNLKFIKPISKESDIKQKFITMDLETREIDGIMSVYCCSIYDGTIIKSYYLKHYSSIDEMLKTAIHSLLLRKYRGMNIYLHNFSKFDVIFLLNILVEISNNNINLILNDKNFISLNLKYKQNYYLKFRDSYLLLPSSLKNLCLSFGLEEKKIFPYKFVNDKTISLDYVGDVPGFNLFDNISLSVYNNYCKEFNKNWSLEKESIKYCERDVIILHKLINKFNLLIFRLTSINAIKYPTLPALSFAVYRSNFLNKFDNIPKLNGEIYNFISKGYYGGAVDVYKPKLIKGKIFRYDVNSLYPYVMSKFDMPVGNPKYFEGDIFKFTDNPFGFFEVEVEAPKFLNHPILLYKTDKTYNYRSIAPLGKWKGVYFSEEIKNCIKYGYKFTVIRGYTFDRKNIFKEYVEMFYNLKQQSDKNDPMYTISKLFLNSLYGKFGMNPDKPLHKIVDSNELEDLTSNLDIISFLQLKNNKMFITYKNSNENEEDNYNSLNINVSIAAAVTAYGRIHMSQFKNSNKFELYYSDTDSMDISEPLDNSMVGNCLGKMKLEYVFKDAVYLAPKVYGCVNIENNEEIIKIKGAKKKISFNNLTSLLKKDEKYFINQEKWYKNLSEGQIKIINEIYTLMITSNKRKLIFDKNNYLIETRPLII
jgi:hypothetical protein